MAGNLMVEDVQIHRTLQASIVFCVCQLYSLFEDLKYFYLNYENNLSLPPSPHPVFHLLHYYALNWAKLLQQSFFYKILWKKDELQNLANNLVFQ